MPAPAVPSHYIRVHTTASPLIFSDSDEEIKDTDIDEETLLPVVQEGVRLRVKARRRHKGKTLVLPSSPRVLRQSWGRVDWALIALLTVAMVVTAMGSMHAGHVVHVDTLVSKCGEDLQECTEMQLGLCMNEILELHHNQDAHNESLLKQHVEQCFYEHHLVKEQFSTLLLVWTVLISFVCGTLLFITGYVVLIYFQLVGSDPHVRVMDQDVEESLNV